MTTHAMNRVREVEGTEEWVCLDCGRDVLIEWHPFDGHGKWRREIIKEGDPTVAHTGFITESDSGEIHA